MWGSVRPHPIDQLVHGDGPSHIDQEGGKNATLASMADVEPPVVESNLDVAEQLELDRHRGSFVLIAA